MQISFNNRTLDLTTPVVMGILNVTPDSFSDGGKFIDKNAAFNHAVQMVKDGADIIDIGGESTRPGAAFVSADEEASRVLPIVKKIAANLDVMISIDTSLIANPRPADREARGFRRTGGTGPPVSGLECGTYSAPSILA